MMGSISCRKVRLRNSWRSNIHWGIEIAASATLLAKAAAASADTLLDSLNNNGDIDWGDMVHAWVVHRVDFPPQKKTLRGKKRQGTMKSTPSF
mmetsp:Transcript_23772/g.49230  ORF Transcript_23772/g.49230 Transcript_23772/m.49230 type:complete len:93 (-) Transcript_23772:87-365(-)